MRVSAHSHNTFHCITENIFRYNYQLVIFLRTTISSVIQWQFWKITYGLVNQPLGVCTVHLSVRVCVGTNLDKMVVLKVDNSNKWSLAKEVCVETNKNENQIKCVTISNNKLVR